MNHRGHRGKPEREKVGEQRAKEITTVNRDVPGFAPDFTV